MESPKKGEKRFSTRCKFSKDLPWEGCKTARLEGSYRGVLNVTPGDLAKYSCKWAWHKRWWRTSEIADDRKYQATSGQKRPEVLYRKKSSQLQGEKSAEREDDQTLFYKRTGSSHFDHRITELPEWWKHEESNAILENNGKGTAQAAVKAQVYSMRGYFSWFYNAGGFLSVNTSWKYLPGREREDLVVLKASAGR